MRNFTYFAPATIGEALDLLRRHPEGTRVLAGGTDLLVRLKRGHWDVRAIVNIKGIRDLARITEENDAIRIGALATVAEIASNDIVRSKIPMLAEAALMMASPQIRNIATIGGNLCNASPAADFAPPLLCLEATVTARSIKGIRTIPIADFFTGPGKNVLNPDEMLTEIRIPAAAARRRGTFQKLEGRKALDISIISVAVAAQRDDGTLRDVRIAVGAASPTPLRATEAEKSLDGKRPSKELIASAAAKASDACRPIGDVRSSAEYRREMVRVHVRRGLETLCS